MALRTRTALTKKIFFDTDCLSSFYWADQEVLLCQMFSDRMVIPKEVYVELSSPAVPLLNKKLIQCVNMLKIEVKEILTGTQEFDLFFQLALAPEDNKGIGKGEAAAISLAKVYDGVIASNNLKDIAKYINKFGLEHLTTADILQEALELSFISEYEGNEIWEKMLSKKRKLPFPSFSDFLKAKK